MADNTNTPLFVIAIGGTGMRCLESFVHLCAIGMFDNKQINILTLDTDFGNGNKERVEQLIDNYIAIKKGNGKELGQPNINTFFSAVLKMKKYATDYNGNARNSYINLAHSTTNLTQEQKEENTDLADLFLDKETVQSFNLAHGYRAQTHLGSMLMYHSILESARNFAEGNNNSKNKDLDEALCEFLEELSSVNSPRVFIFGSIFGGTGASSIPIIPVAFRDAVQLMGQIKEGSASLDFDEVKFGASLLTDYFTFRSPQQNQKQVDKVIADSANFALNCQAALDFYAHDPTVRQVYKRFYNVGWPMIASKLNDESDKDVITGGNKQKNACHIVELMCACAAYDFFTLPDSELTELKFCYRSPEFDQNYKFSGKDFMGVKGDLFTNKLGSFLSFAHIVLSEHKGAKSSVNGVKDFLIFLKDRNINDYESTDEWNDYDQEQITYYLRKFAYELSSDGELIPGWLFQIYNSVGQAKFLFNSSAFQEDAIKNGKVNFGAVFDDDLHNWKNKGKVWGFNPCNNNKDSYDALCKAMAQDKARDFSKQNVASTEEKFLAHIYNAITMVQTTEKGWD